MDVTDAPLTFATDIDGLEIELTQWLTTVSGSVSNRDGGVALDATVIAFADDPDVRSALTVHPKRARSAGPICQAGAAARAYRAIAVGYLEPGEEQDPDVLAAWPQIGTGFVLSEARRTLLI